jgi:hypothetical protein
VASETQTKHAAGTAHQRSRHAHSDRLNGVVVWLMTVMILMVTCRWVGGMVWVGALTLCGDVSQVRGTHCIHLNIVTKRKSE